MHAPAWLHTVSSDKWQGDYGFCTVTRCDAETLEDQSRVGEVIFTHISAVLGDLRGMQNLWVKPMADPARV